MGEPLSPQKHGFGVFRQPGPPIQTLTAMTSGSPLIPPPMLLTPTLCALTLLPPPQALQLCTPPVLQQLSTPMELLSQSLIRTARFNSQSKPGLSQKTLA